MNEEQDSRTVYSVEEFMQQIKELDTGKWIIWKAATLFQGICQMSDEDLLKVRELFHQTEFSNEFTLCINSKSYGLELLYKQLPGGKWSKTEEFKTF